MTLRQCSECGYDVLDEATACPHCGCPVSEMDFPEETPLSEFEMNGTCIEQYLGSSEHVVIPDFVTEIGECAFNFCASLESVVIPDSVAKIDEDAFIGCFSLREITIPDSVTEIGERAFLGCEALEKFSISSGNQNHFVNDGILFSKAEKMLITYPAAKDDTAYKIPDFVTEIGEGAFYGCTSLESVVITDTVTKINGDAFKGCTSLREITIPDSVTKIGEKAFWDCTSLSSIFVSKSVTSIGKDAFFDLMPIIRVTVANEQVAKLVKESGYRGKLIIVN